MGVTKSYLLGRSPLPGLFSIGFIVLVPIVNDGASLFIGQLLPSTFGAVYEQGVGLCM